jgi:hypothetical protein
MVIEFISLHLTMAELLFLFLKVMTGAFATFSYLVFNIFDVFINIKIYVNVHCHLLALRLKLLQC